MHLRAYLFGCLGNLRVAFTDIDLQCLYILEGSLIGAVVLECVLACGEKRH